MATIGIGRDDPRRWVKAAYLLIDAMECGETGPQGQLPTRSEVAARLSIGEGTVARAYRELRDMGIIYRVDGYGYFPNVAARRRCADARTGRLGQ
jgi:DNA-binding GntR family transcriptional regulator